MPILLDHAPVSPALGNKPTIGDALVWVQRSLPTGKVVTRIELDGTLLEGLALANARAMLLGGRKPLGQILRPKGVISHDAGQTRRAH